MPKYEITNFELLKRMVSGPMPENDACLVWPRGLDRHGYGKLRPGVNRTPHVLAHRFSYHLAHGALETTLLVCHKCDNPPCIRPDHLFLGTPKDNMQDCARKGRRARHGITMNCKLDAEAVRMIRKLYDAGYSIKWIASLFEVKRGAIDRIGSRRTWVGVSEL